MAHQHKDVGVKYNGLRILEVFKKVCGKRDDFMAYCECDCGEKSYHWLRHIKYGSVVSCGCYNSKLITDRNTTHNLSSHPIYIVWRGMKDRCYLTTHHKYKDYGGRGIVVCQDWRYSVENFYDWMVGNGWCKGLSIDRIDNNGNYTPCNCRLATNSQQANNTRNSFMITAFGQTKTAIDWSKDSRCNVSASCIRQRIMRDRWSPEKAINQPSRIKKDNYESTMQSQ